MCQPKLEWVNTDHLLALRRNPQYLSPHEMEALKESIKRDGFLAPVLLRPRGKGDYEILSGNHRVMAARELRMPSVPAIIVKMDDKAAARVAVNLNTVHGDPTAELLAPFLAELDDDILRTVHLDDDLRAAVMEIDESLAASLSSMEVPENWNEESKQSNIATCRCPKCGKGHISAFPNRPRTGKRVRTGKKTAR